MSVQSKMMDDEFYSDERGVCGACGSEYEPYAVMLTDDFVAISDHVSIKEHFGWLCPDCRRDYSSGGYAIIDDPGKVTVGEEVRSGGGD